MKNKKIFLFLFIVLVFSAFYAMSFFVDDVEIKADTVLANKEENFTNSEEKLVKVDIKGAVKKEGVYEIVEGSRIIDQTTTNMIQRISYLFAINPLKSKEI